MLLYVWSPLFVWMGRACQTHLLDPHKTCSGCHGNSLLIGGEGIWRVCSHHFISCLMQCKCNIFTYRASHILDSDVNLTNFLFGKFWLMLSQMLYSLTSVIVCIATVPLNRLSQKLAATNAVLMFSLCNYSNKWSIKNDQSHIDTGMSVSPPASACGCVETKTIWQSQ